MALYHFLICRDEETEAQRNKGSHSALACLTQAKAQFPLWCPRISKADVFQTLEQMHQPHPFPSAACSPVLYSAMTLIRLVCQVAHGSSEALVMGSCPKGPDSFLAVIASVSLISPPACGRVCQSYNQDPPPSHPISYG